jgi:hypothetical protein
LVGLEVDGVADAEAVEAAWGRVSVYGSGLVCKG